MKFKAVIAVLLAAGLLALVMISKSLERSSEAMSRELRTALDNQSGVSLVINELGYTGFIHNFKNYVLRGDEAYYQAASADLRRLNGLFANYRHLQQDRSAAMQAHASERAQDHRLRSVHHTYTYIHTKISATRRSACAARSV